MFKIAMGADHRGYGLKEELKKHLKNKACGVKDYGTFKDDAAVDYPYFALKVCEAVARGGYERGILVCGSGIGMCIAANKVPGIRAALVYSIKFTRMTARHNKPNVLCLSGSTDVRKAKRMVEVWLGTVFDGGRHEKRIAMITGIEKKYVSRGKG